MANETLYDDFLRAPLTDSERADLTQNKSQWLKDTAFAALPSFGTGGMRSITGLGSNRLNIYNIARLNLALAKEFAQDGKPKLCVLAFDSRLTSNEFSRVSYHVLTARGFTVKVFRRPTPTPFLSFAVRELKADCGVVITASHNPPQYNGYKVYAADGGQSVSPTDKIIQSNFDAMSYADLPHNLHALTAKPIPDSDLIEEDIVLRYLNRLRKEVFVSQNTKQSNILYSPLHGTGGWIFERVYRELGYKNFHVLPEQAEPDGNFPTVKSPNPEERSAFDRLVEAGTKQNADLLIATDPDADRVGCMIRSDDGFAFLTGNQIGCLLLESIARKKAKSLKSPFICKTIVTTELQKRIADYYQIRTVETLTGFKYIAEQIAKDPENYLFGGEESFGYLPVSWVRDKDSISSAIALTELSEDAKLADMLSDIYLRHGLFHEELVNIDLSKNPTLLQETLERLKDSAQFASQIKLTRPLIDILDLRKNAREPNTSEAKSLKASLGHADVIQFWLAEDSRLTIRPSGTEPKIKIYLSLKSAHKPTEKTLQADKQALKNEADEILKIFQSALKLN